MCQSITSDQDVHPDPCVPAQAIQEKPVMASTDKAPSFATKIKEKLQSLALRSVKHHCTYVYHLTLRPALLPLILALLISAFTNPQLQMLEQLSQTSPTLTGVPMLMLLTSAIFLTIILLLAFKQQTIYVVDFACFKLGDHRKCRGQLLEYFGRRSGMYSEELIDFQRKVLLKSGLGEETYLPPFIFHDPPIKPSMNQARLEAEEVIIGAMDKLLDQTGLKPHDIDILIVNCSCFSPTPSLASMVVNHFKLKSSVCSLNLGGMGCSVGAVAIDLGKRLLRSSKNSNAVVVSTENITFNWYCGKNRSMLVPNCLFRVGAAAVLLSNKRSHRSRAKYQLHCTVRTHTAADDNAYGSIYQEEDDEGIVGVSLSKYIMKAASDALRDNMTRLGPLVLPYSEQLRFLINFLSRKLLPTPQKAYTPQFKLAFQHFLVHPGGRGVLDEVQKKLSLTDHHMEASRMTLHRFGNTSSSSIWYELAYLEAKQRVKRGDQLWLVGLGAGFKCSSVVLRALHTVQPSCQNPWMEDIHNYPTKILTDRTDLIRSEKLLHRTNSGSLFDCMKGQRVASNQLSDEANQRETQTIIM